MGRPARCALGEDRAATASPATPDVGRSLRTRLLASFFVAIALPLAVLGLYAVRALERATLDHLLDNLRATARLTAAEVAAEPEGTPVEARIDRWAQVLQVRIAVANLRGTIIAASAGLPPGLAREPGLDAALQGAIAQGQVADASGERWLYAAAPVERAGTVTGAVDLLLRLRSVQGVFWRVRWALAAAFGIAAVLAGGLVLYLTQALFGPIAAMKAAAERIGVGDLQQRLPERPDELGDLARVLNAMARQLNERETRRRDFLANVSHELRTPVANVQFTAQALLAGAADDPDHRRRMLETIVRESERLARLVRQLLDLLSLQSGRLPLARDVVEVPDLLEDAVARFAVRAAAAGVHLGALPGAALPAIEGDPDRLAEVLDNLVDNALRSTPAGGSVTLAAHAEGAAVVVEVADTGRGIPEADVPFVFEKFYRGGTARDRASGGSGLGLAIVKAIVEAHGGRISVESRVAAGTRFVIRLPARSPRGAPEGRTLHGQADPPA
jgi:signal transduction histidine kinase